MFELVDSATQSAVIKVIGIGGGGGNAVSHMLSSDVDGVEFICANTDAVQSFMFRTHESSLFASTNAYHLLLCTKR